jgi:hypothetical protein
VQPVVDSVDLPSLGGAPDSHEGRTIAAFVDVVVPGKHRDPKGVLGALDVEAASKFFEAGSQISTLVPLLVSALDSYSRELYRREFVALKASVREEVVAYALEQFPQIEFAVQLAKLSYFSTPQVATLYGYPGANSGYINDANFSFRREMSAKHPLTVLGNLP